MSPFVPAPDAVVAAFAREWLEEGDTLWDLGCGDAKLLLAAARARPGVACVGVEVLPKPVEMARRAWEDEPRPDVRSRVDVFRGDLFASEVRERLRRTSQRSECVVWLYHLPDALPALARLLLETLQDGARVVCLTFPLPPTSLSAPHVPRALALRREMFVPGVQPRSAGHLMEYLVTSVPPVI